MNNNEARPAYSLVEFKEENKGNKKSIECVSSSWVDFDIDKDSCVARYMELPSEGNYSKEDLLLIRTLTKQCVKAPAGWPEFPVILKSMAETYKDDFSIAKGISRQWIIPPRHVVIAQMSQRLGEIKREIASSKAIPKEHKPKQDK